MRILVLGKTNSGKSYYVYHKLYGKLRDYNTLLYIDPKPSPFVQPIRADGKIITHLSQLKNLKTSEIILKPHFASNFEENVETILRYIIQKKSLKKHNRSLQIIVDEAHRLGTKFSSMPEFYKIVAEGEAHNIDTIIINQHPRSLRNDIILNCEKVYLFGYHPFLSDYFCQNLEVELSEKDIAWLKKKYHGISYDYNTIEQL